MKPRKIDPTVMVKLRESTFANIPARSYVMLHLNGHAFNNWKRKFVQPFDDEFIYGMDRAATSVAKSISGSKVGHVQENEINILITDWDTRSSKPYANNDIQKIVSRSASIASSSLTQIFPEEYSIAFEAKLFAIPTPELVFDWFVWRQIASTKKSILSVANRHFTAKDLVGVKHDDLREMLSNVGDNWDNYIEGEKNGRLIYREPWIRSIDAFDEEENKKRRIRAEGAAWTAVSTRPFGEIDILKQLIPTPFRPEYPIKP